MGASGNTEAMLGFGGYVGPSTNYNSTENWNGTSWTEVNNLNTSGYAMGSSGQGTNTSALAFGRYKPGTSPDIKSVTEDWNGVSWQEVADLNTARYALGSAGTATNALAFGGKTSPGDVAATEEWNGSTVSTKTIDTD